MIDNTTRSIFAENLRRYSEKLNINQTEIASRLKVSTATASDWFNGKKYPRPEKMQKIADIFGVKVSDLQKDTHEPSNLVLLDQSKVRMLPTYESVSAGFGALASSQIVTYTPVFIQCDAEAVDSLCINVKGNSMYPKIEDGDLVVVRKQSSVDNGQIAVVLIDGDEGLVKKVYYGNGWIELVSINPEYAPKRFEGSEAKRVEVVGLVRKIIKNCE